MQSPDRLEMVHGPSHRDRRIGHTTVSVSQVVENRWDQPSDRHTVLSEWLWHGCEVEQTSSDFVEPGRDLLRHLQDLQSRRRTLAA